MLWTFVISEEVYNTSCRYFLGTRDEFLKICEDEELARSEELGTFFEDLSIVWVNTAELQTNFFEVVNSVLHETTHFAICSFSLQGIPLTDANGNNEPFVYFLSYYCTQAIKRLSSLYHYLQDKDSLDELEQVGIHTLTENDDVYLSWEKEKCRFNFV